MTLPFWQVLIAGSGEIVEFPTIDKAIAYQKYLANRGMLGIIGKVEF